jgi:deoxyribodipyrimidine photolyase-related protein
MAELRFLIVVLGDQLDRDAAAFDGFDAGLDAVWMPLATAAVSVRSCRPTPCACGLPAS